MYKDHRIPLLQFTIIGVGANGSHFFRSLCQDLRTHLNRPGFDKAPSFKLGHIMLVDGDVCESKNLANQVFDKDDVGEHKVIALAERYGEHYDLPILRYPEYVRDIDTLNNLMGVPEHNPKTTMFMPVLIGMIDNVRP
ncbi:ThiF family adenylyltransferase [Paenibacillus sp. yr247]|uniref:ThiF family adenylyltransferase n=1 Tax=Paenibacillus sp. yr247 TaxID=1761880 RepID=UPI0034A1C4C3